MPMLSLGVCAQYSVVTLRTLETRPCKYDDLSIIVDINEKDNARFRNPPRGHQDVPVVEGNQK